MSAPDGHEAADVRTAELAEGLGAVRARIRAACAACGRDPQEVTLVVVTKFFPAQDVARLARLGVRDIGENRDQEASAKVAEVRELAAGDRSDEAGGSGKGGSAGQSGEVGEVPTVHFIGQIQTNKAGSVARYADVVHSVDREKLARSLQRGAHAADRTIEVLLQVNLDPEPADSAGGGTASRGGVAPADLAALAATVADCPALRLRGLMGVAPLGGDPAQAFERLAQLSAQLRRTYPDADVVSAGMSGDLEAAIAAGATHLRVGSAILGSRRPHG